MTLTDIVNWMRILHKYIEHELNNKSGLCMVANRHDRNIFKFNSSIHLITLYKIK